MINRARELFRAGKIDEAQALATKTLEKSPDHSDAISLLSLIALRRGEHERAEELVVQAITTNPNKPIYHDSYGVILQADGRLEAALAAFDRALSLNPNLAIAHLHRGSTLHSLGRIEEALDAYNRAIDIRPQLSDAYMGKGSSLMRLNRMEEALGAYKQAIRKNPDFLHAYHSIGNVLARLGRFEEALAAYDQVIRINQDFALVQGNRGNVLNQLGRVEEALAAYEQAIRLAPQYAEAHSNRGNTLMRLGRIHDALSAHEEAIRLKPEYAEAHSGRADALRPLGRLADAERSCRRALELKPGSKDVHSNLLFLLAAQADLSPDMMLEEHRQWDRVHGRHGAENLLPQRKPQPLDDRRLRVGYVSPNLYDHSVTYFFESLLAGHDQSVVEVFCYDANPSGEDDMTARLRNIAEHWRSVADKTDEQLAQLIHQDAIDVLVDLAGHTANNRLGAFTYRPALVQATYLGYFAGTGLKAMDYWITDAVLHPPDTVEKTVEQIFRLPRCWLSYRPPDDAPEVAPCPNDDQQVVFGSFHESSKLTPKVIETWSELLHRLPGSRLLIMDASLQGKQNRQLLVEAFAQHSIPEQRLIIKKAAPFRDYLATYAEVDIVLDTFPRTGGTTTAEALWMGVPVVTLAGQRYVERISTGKLAALGLTELISFDEEDYIAKSLSLARDPARRAELRATLREMIRQSSLYNGDTLARAMEDAYRAMWDMCLSQRAAARR